MVRRKKITETMAAQLSDGILHEIHDIRYFDGETLNQFDAVIMGVSVRYGRFQPAFHRLVSTYAGTLNTMNGTLFTVSLVAKKPHKCTPEGNSYTRKLLAPAVLPGFCRRSALVPVSLAGQADDANDRREYGCDA